MNFRDYEERLRSQFFEPLLQNDKKLEKAIRELAAKQGRAEQKERIEVQKDIIAHQYEKSAAYTNLVVVGGYVALFNMWGSVRETLPEGLMLLFGGLATISAVLFVGFHVAEMVMRTMLDFRISLKLQGEMVAWKEDPFAALTASYSRTMHWAWVVMLVPTAITGFASAGILTWGFWASTLSSTPS